MGCGVRWGDARVHVRWGDARVHLWVPPPLPLHRRTIQGTLPALLEPLHAQCATVEHCCYCCMLLAACCLLPAACVLCACCVRAVCVLRVCCVCAMCLLRACMLRACCCACCLRRYYVLVEGTGSVTGTFSLSWDVGTSGEGSYAPLSPSPSPLPGVTSDPTPSPSPTETPGIAVIINGGGST
jgi:hypothetical protein